MPARSPRVPKLRHHKGRDQALVSINGRTIYLGRWNSAKSRAKYAQVIAEFLATGTPALPTIAPALEHKDDEAPSIAELIDAYSTHCQSYYRKDGKVTSQYDVIKAACRALRELYGFEAAKSFGALALKALQGHWVRQGLSRSGVNRNTATVKQFVKWATANELIPPSVFQAISTVPGLRKGRTEARETEPVRPVSPAAVDAVEPFVSRQVWAMIELQRLTGCRPGEVCMMRTRDISTTGPVWEYRPQSHKTEHHGRERIIPLGPNAQAVLRPWLRPALDEPLFSPIEAEAERRKALRAARKTKVPPSQKARRRKRKPERSPGNRYRVGSYKVAIARACRRAGVEPWHPNPLRHLAATLLRKHFGLEVAKAILGRAHIGTTQIYAEIDQAAATEAMLKLG
jgi:integrase